MPAPPDFRSNTPGSAWWVQARQQCAQDGWSLLRDLQEVLHTRLATTDPALAASLEAAPERRGWDAPLLDGILALATQYRAPTRYLDAVRGDRAAGRVASPETLATAIWLAHYASGFTRDGREVFGIGSPAEVEVPLPFTPPTWNTPIQLPVEVITGIVCRPVSTVTPPAPPPLPAPSLLEDYGPVVLAVTVLGGGLLAALLTSGARTYAEERAARPNPIGGYALLLRARTSARLAAQHAARIAQQARLLLEGRPSADVQALVRATESYAQQAQHYAARMQEMASVGRSEEWAITAERYAQQADAAYRRAVADAARAVHKNAARVESF